MNTPLVNYNLPSICACCAAPAPKNSWKIERWNVSMNPLALLATVVLLPLGIQFFSATKHTTSFSVRVCDDCLKILKRKRMLYQYSGLAAVAVPTILMLVISSSNWYYYATNNPQVFLLMAVVIFVGMIYFSRQQIGYLDAQYFHFENPEFHRQFAQLNPRLIGVTADRPHPGASS